MVSEAISSLIEIERNFGRKLMETQQLLKQEHESKLNQLSQIYTTGIEKGKKQIKADLDQLRQELQQQYETLAQYYTKEMEKLRQMKEQNLNEAKEKLRSLFTDPMR